tara:strand:+ start:197 stop:493 length:297 start_codon:yes stop_codon:yes gene_type:complete
MLYRSFIMQIRTKLPKMLVKVSFIFLINFLTLFSEAILVYLRQLKNSLGNMFLNDLFKKFKNPFLASWVENQNSSLSATSAIAAILPEPTKLATHQES